MENYIITVKIGADDLKSLKESRYKLCVACSLQDEEQYNVIWYAAGNFIEVNKIELAKDYEIFVSQSFVQEQLVSEDVLPVPIDMGQECTLKSYGVISDVRSGKKDSCIKLLNQYGEIYPGLKRGGRGVTREVIMNPFFVSQYKMVPGTFEFLPSPVICLWFAQKAESGMISLHPKSSRQRSAVTFDIQVDLLKNPNPVIAFSHAEWKII